MVGADRIILISRPGFKNRDIFELLDLQTKMENYTLIKRLGAGSFGTTHLAKNKHNGKEVVVKERGLTA